MTMPATSRVLPTFSADAVMAWSKVCARTWGALQSRSNTSAPPGCAIRLAAVERALERQEIVSKQREDFRCDARSRRTTSEAAMVLMSVRNGRVTGRATSIVDKVEEVTTPELVERMVREVYGDDTPPPEVLVQELPEGSRGVDRVALPAPPDPL